MKNFIEKYFKLNELNTNIRTELIAGATTFMTMAYIIFVNPAMISKTGMDFGAAMTATCLSAAIATIMMGVYVNYPIALAPGMGQNAFFTYTVCLTMGVPWRTALGCVFVEGVIFLLLTFTQFRQMLITAIPPSIRYGIACGIGLLISFIGLIDAGVIVGHPSTLVTLGNVASPAAFMALFGLVASTVMMVRGVKGALLWGILLTAVTGIPLGLVKYQGIVAAPPSMAPTFLQMDLAKTLDITMLPVIFVFLFMGVFDTVGTLAGVGEMGGFMKDGKLPRSGKAFFTDALSTCVGAACGTPTVTCYVESASGIAAGGRSGLASVVTGLLLFSAMFFSPLVRMIGGGYVSPQGALLHPVTAPALIIVGCMIMGTIVKISWDDFSEAVPAFLTIIIMPLTFSIANGIATGFMSYALIKIFTGRGKEVSLLVYFLAALFVLKFIFLR